MRKLFFFIYKKNKNRPINEQNCFSNLKAIYSSWKATIFASSIKRTVSFVFRPARAIRSQSIVFIRRLVDGSRRGSLAVEASIFALVWRQQAGQIDQKYSQRRLDGQIIARITISNRGTSHIGPKVHSSYSTLLRWVFERRGRYQSNSIDRSIFNSFLLLIIFFKYI